MTAEWKASVDRHTHAHASSLTGTPGAVIVCGAGYNGGQRAIRPLMIVLEGTYLQEQSLYGWLHLTLLQKIKVFQRFLPQASHNYEKPGNLKTGVYQLG